MKFPKPKIVSFRDEIEDVNNTSYLTHSLYYHPAKFIPQIVRYCLNKYTKNKGKTLDPFAGSGTTGLEAVTNGYSATLTDINPLLEYFYEIKLPEFSAKEWSKNVLIAEREIDTIFNIDISEIKNKKYDKRLEYWYPIDLLTFFTEIWGRISKKNKSISKVVLILIFFKISKKYSYAEHSMPKLFTSKRKRKEIEETQRGNGFGKTILEEARRELKKINKSVSELLTNYNLKKVDYYSGVDAYTFPFNKKTRADSIITSPPYLQAQEYIRTFKLEMMWLGYSNEKIKSFSKKEIPFRKPEGTITGQYIDKKRDRIKNKKLKEMFDSYFWFTIKALENASTSLKRGGRLCVLVGNPVMEKETVEIWKVIYEYFVSQKGYKLLDVFEDRIVSRKLFGGRKNNNPDGMRYEYLIVLEK
ncbi:hypothetical protein A3A74_01430 [Candidatus Roizmanbacteria bacterium RIFCSPLOWO2_01_FULL_35_13]|uniref:DNA methylase N-4/N-6 domain-containing protein n=1 Tax=Candidatus Roizmanbacteria bacterium RIFCSPLOWO2_01_FULL_35_13 TaxID=1802055 RepID=A0A1F7ICE1_9BACT|nr:MAG: hypothetical protein A3A74_01430 [Candidatus Roizmanbacteria bacterium RIFCSPLOWO2_01_FULL_35_13]